MTADPIVTATIVLAAGGSSRFGSPKLAAPVDGRPMLTGLLETLADHAPKPRVVVLGAHAEVIGDLIPDDEWSIVINDDHSDGLGSSLRAGLAAVEEADQVLVVLGDLAWLQGEAISRVMEHAGDSDAYVVRAFEGEVPGHPLLLRGEALEIARGHAGEGGMLPHLSELSVDRVECEGLGVASDVDTIDDLES